MKEMSVIGIAEAASILESHQTLAVVSAGGLLATKVKDPSTGKSCVLVQGSSTEFLFIQ